MVADVVLPQMGLEVSEGTVTAILVAVGDAVAEGDTVAEVETDKAIAEIAAPRSGVVTSIEVGVGDTIPVGAKLIAIGDSAGDAAPAAAGDGAAGLDDAALDAEAAADVEAAAEPQESGASANQELPRAPRGAGAPAAPESSNGAHRRRAAPIARRAAAELGIDLERIEGSGPAGRITLGDVERAAAATGTEASGAAATGAAAPAEAATGAPAPGPPAASPARLEPLSATRQSIARRLTEAQLVPTYTLTREIDASWLLAEKSRLSAAGPAKVGVVDLLLQAFAETLARHRQLAASFVPAADGEPPRYRHPEEIDLGLAVATDRGLLVPVLRGVDRRPLPDLVLERARLIETTRSGRLGLAEMSGAVATLSSLGTFGVDSFEAMLNPGESVILAVGRSVEKVVPRDRGLAVVPTLSLTFTLDHRVVDGATGAAALAELADLLEGGMQWRT